MRTIAGMFLRLIKDDPELDAATVKAIFKKRPRTSMATTRQHNRRPCATKTPSSRYESDTDSDEYLVVTKHEEVKLLPPSLTETRDRPKFGAQAGPSSDISQARPEDPFQDEPADRVPWFMKKRKAN